MVTQSAKGRSPLKIILLVLGGIASVVLLACCGFAGLVGYQFSQLPPMESAGPRDPCQAAFSAANSSIVTDAKGVAHGETEQARDLAEHYSVALKSLREAFFTKRKKPALISASGGNFLTYCHLDEERCVFLVHVPDLRKFEKDAKDSLVEFAWMTAQSVVATQLEQPPPTLVVGVRGMLLYEAVMIGQPTPKGAEDGPPAESVFRGALSDSKLHPFFCPADADEDMAESADADQPAPGAAAPADPPSDLPPTTTDPQR